MTLVYDTNLASITRSFGHIERTKAQYLLKRCLISSETKTVSIQRLSTSGAGRGFPKKSIILNNPKLSAFFREVLVSDSYTEKQDTDPLLDMCNMNGWLQAESYPGPDDNVTYVFPSRLHRGYAILLTSWMSSDT